jgi:predicted dehydrogenase
MTEFRLGVVGIDGSHCYNFTEVLHAPGSTLGARVLFYWAAGESEMETKSAAILERLGVQRVAHWEEMLDKIDGVLVTPYYHPRDNYALARPFLEAGVPTYVDKILATSSVEAKRLVALASEKGVPLMADSALRYVPEVQAFHARRSAVGKLESGVVAGPGDVTAYGHHTIRLMQGVFGSGVDWVSNWRDAARDVATVHYRSGATVALFLHRAATKRGWRFAYFGEQETGVIEIDIRNIYPPLVQEIVAVLRGERPGPMAAELLEVVAIAEAMRCSAPTGARVMLEALLAEEGFGS